VEAAPGSPTTKRARQLRKAAKVSKFAYQAPQSLYSAVILMPVLIEADDPYEWFRWHGMGYFWMAVNFTTQVLFMVGVHDVCKQLRDRGIAEGCNDLFPYLLAAAFFCTTVCVMTDLQDTWDILYMLRKHVPTVETTSVLKFKPDADGELKLAEGGMSLLRKILIGVCILLPKLLLAIALLLMGFAFLSVSPKNVDIILNATALVFIIEMDEALFDYFSLPEVRSLMGAMPTFEEEDPSGVLVKLRPLWRFLKFLLCCAVVAVGMVTYHWCGHEGHFLPLVD